jgi:hypothetical protein
MLLKATSSLKPSIILAKRSTMSHKSISRRALLKGAFGVSLALPFLDIMYSPAYAQTVSNNKRFFVYYAPNGIHAPAFTPVQAGDLDLVLPPSLSSLEALRHQIMVVSNLYNQPASVPLAGDHARGTGGFLTAQTCFKTDGAQIRNGISIDQVIANQIGNQYRFPSLAFGAEGGSNIGGCDSGYSCVYSRNISWVSEFTPSAKEVNVKLAFERLFSVDSNGLSPEAKARIVAQKKSILDFVAEDSMRLKSKIGIRDQQKLDEYLTSIRELERQIEFNESNQNQGCLFDPSMSQRYQNDVNELSSKVKLFLDLIVLAFQCQLTPVISFMQANAASNIAYHFIGVADGHHQISHHQDQPENFEKLKKIDQWTISQYAYILDKLAQIPEGEGSLLDQTLCMFSSEIQDGNRHNHNQLPMIIAGAKDFFPKNKHYAPAESKIASLYMTFAQYYGITLNQFGDADMPLSLSM